MEQFLYSVDSAARALDVSRAKIYNLMKIGALSFVKIGADRRIPAAELKRLAEEGSENLSAEKTGVE